MSQDCCNELTEAYAKIEQLERYIEELKETIKCLKNVIRQAASVCQQIIMECDTLLSAGNLPRPRWAYLKGARWAAATILGTLHLC